MNFPQYLEKKYLEWQQVVGERKTVREFAEYIGVSASSITMWWKGKRTPEGDNIQKLAEKLGIEVYDILEIPRPNENLYYLIKEWDNYSTEHQKAIREFAANKRYNTEENEFRKAQIKRKPRSTD